VRAAGFRLAAGSSIVVAMQHVQTQHHPRPTRRTTARRLVGLALAAATVAPVGLIAGGTAGASSTASHTAAPFPTGTFTGTLADGATWTIRVPPNWNRTLLLFSHGLVPPGEENPARDAPDPVTGEALLAAGFALAGSSYATTGYAVEEALRDQREVLDEFRQQVGKPARTIAWGSSLGGMVTAALLERSPQRFDGGLSMCGVLAGTVGLWNTYLDALFVLRTFLAPDVDLVHITDPFAAIDTMRTALVAAQQTPEGRARIALAAAVADVPGWINADLPRPDPDDVATQQAAQFEHFQTLLLFGLALRADVETRAGGNPSSNVDVDYAALLRRSNGRREVRALYEQAGLDLDADLDVLAAAPRIVADPAAVQYATDNVVFDGEIRDPLLTLHTNGDQLVVVEQERAYADTVGEAGTRSLVRQAFIERAGHCTFTPAETIAALQALIARIDDGHWRNRTDADTLNAAATALGPDLNVHFDEGTGSLVPTYPAFDNRRPGPFLRPFDLA
jgi:pimeloyl-ACP methyl ester carboxylesterase